MFFSLALGIMNHRICQVYHIQVHTISVSSPQGCSAISHGNVGGKGGDQLAWMYGTGKNSWIGRKGLRICTFLSYFQEITNRTVYARKVLTILLQHFFKKLPGSHQPLRFLIPRSWRYSDLERGHWFRKKGCSCWRRSALITRYCWWLKSCNSLGMVYGGSPNYTNQNLPQKRTDSMRPC